MEQITTKIQKIEILDDKIIIKTIKGDFYASIIKGSVQFDIYNNEKRIMPLTYIEEEDIIKIKHKDRKIMRIYVNTKYEILSESSEENIF
jgi:hypothetical protein